MFSESAPLLLPCGSELESGDDRTSNDNKQDLFIVVRIVVAAYFIVLLLESYK